MPAGSRRHLVGKTLINVFHCDITEIRFVGRGVARSKYVGWTDMASAEHEPTRGVWRRSRRDRLPYLSPCKKSSDLYQFQERPLAKVGWTSPPRGDATAHTGWLERTEFRPRYARFALLTCCRLSEPLYSDVLSSELAIPSRYPSR